MASSFRLFRVATVLFALLASGRSAWAQWTPDGVSVLFGPVFVATVGAASDLNCYGLAFWDFRPIVESDPRVAWPLLQAMAARLRHAEAEPEA